MNAFEHGELLTGRSKNFVCEGHFVGLIKLMDGTAYAVIQPYGSAFQFYFVDPKTLSKTPAFEGESRAA